MNKYLTLCLLFHFSILIKAQIIVHDSLVEISLYASLPAIGNIPVCLSILPNGNFCYNDLDGNIYQINNGLVQLMYTKSDHKLSYVSHMEVKDDFMYISGSVIQNGDSTMIGYVMKGYIPTNSWDTLAVSDPYYLGLSFNDHRFSSLIVSENGEDLFVQSGSRTNSGEIHELPGVNGTIGLRNQPIRGKLFKIPTNNTQIVQIPNDSSLLYSSGYMFAEGLRHMYALAWGTDGSLFGASNSDRRDADEGFYKIEESKHYGFPWWIGGVENPLQFSTYNPDVDLLLPAGANAQGYYNTDFNFPPMPTNIDFVQPYKNIGPDADKYRDKTDGIIKDASDEGGYITSFSAHRSPVGLIFDTKEKLPNEFKGKGFLVSYNNNSKLLNDDGHDLLQLHLLPGDSMSVRKLVSGFIKPIDAIIKDSMLYILDMGNNNGLGKRVYQVSFKDSTLVQSTGIESFKNEANSIQFVPNPTSGKIYLHSEDLDRIANIGVFDLSGKLLYKWNKSELEIDLSSYAPQIFLIEINLSDGQKFVEKIIKN